MSESSSRAKTSISCNTFWTASNVAAAVNTACGVPQRNPRSLLEHLECEDLVFPLWKAESERVLVVVIQDPSLEEPDPNL